MIAFVQPVINLHIYTKVVRVVAVRFVTLEAEWETSSRREDFPGVVLMSPQGWNNQTDAGQVSQSVIPVLSHLMIPCQTSQFLVFPDRYIVIGWASETSDILLIGSNDETLSFVCVWPWNQQTLGSISTMLCETFLGRKIVIGHNR